MVHTVQSHVSFNCIDFLLSVALVPHRRQSYSKLYIYIIIHKIITCMFGAT